jgi:hypothetical protein
MSWHSNVGDRFHFLKNRLDSRSGDPISEIFEFISTEKGFLSIDFESCILDSAENDVQVVHFLI